MKVLVTTPQQQTVTTVDYLKSVPSQVSISWHWLNIVNFFLGTQAAYPAIVGGVLFQWTGYIDNDGLLLVTAISNSIGIVVAMYFLWPDIIDSLRLFKQKALYFTMKSVTSIGYILLGNVILNLLIQWLTGNLQTPVNQDNINAFAQVNPTLMFVIAVVLAPLLEEMVFRGTIFRMLFDKHGTFVALLASSVLFGLMHVLSSLISGNYADLINVVVYIHMGIQLGYLYDRTGTLVAPIMLHAVNNLISFIVMVS